MTDMLAATAKRSDRPKRQLFIYPRIDTDGPLPAQKRKLYERQLLADTPNLTDDRNVVVSGKAGFTAKMQKADVQDPYTGKGGSR